jgi:hypothetical protein
LKVRKILAPVNQKLLQGASHSSRSCAAPGHRWRAERRRRTRRVRLLRARLRVQRDRTAPPSPPLNPCTPAGPATRALTPTSVPHRGRRPRGGRTRPTRAEPVEVQRDPSASAATDRFVAGLPPIHRGRPDASPSHGDVVIAPSTARSSRSSPITRGSRVSPKRSSCSGLGPLRRPAPDGAVRAAGRAMRS